MRVIRAEAGDALDMWWTEVRAPDGGCVGRNGNGEEMMDGAHEKSSRVLESDELGASADQG